MINQIDHIDVLHDLIENSLRPEVKKIDNEAFYAEDFLRLLGKKGFLSSTDKTNQQRVVDEAYVVKEVAKVCMTTAFCLWCHLASLTYIRNTTNDKLQKTVLSCLEDGTLLGGTGLSNPMKYLAGLENIHLTAKVTDEGYIVSGTLPYISNLGSNHVFGFVASVENASVYGKPERMMGLIDCSNEHLTLYPRANYIGMNGSATYACQFKDVFISHDAVIAENADKFIDSIRPHFIAYQIPLSMGVIESSIESIEKVSKKQNGCNQFLKVQSKDLIEKNNILQQKFYTLIQKTNPDKIELLQLRLASAYDVLEAVQTAMLHHGGAAYIQNSTPDRKLREAYFYANLTPTIKQLEKDLSTP